MGDVLCTHALLIRREQYGWSSVLVLDDCDGSLRYSFVAEILLQGMFSSFVSIYSSTRIQAKYFPVEVFSTVIFLMNPLNVLSSEYLIHLSHHLLPML